MNTPPPPIQYKRTGTSYKDEADQIFRVTLKRGTLYSRERVYPIISAVECLLFDLPYSIRLLLVSL